MVKIFFYSYLIFFVPFSRAEIIAPNADFSLKTIENYLPGKSIEELKKQNPKFDLFLEEGDKRTYRFKIIKAAYTLDIYTQVKKNLITDFLIRLPQYFLHDLILKELQTKWNKQDRYIRHDRSALYVWLNKENTNIIYHGSCSITCFPMFFEIVSTEKTVIPLYEKLNLALPKW